LALFRVKFAFFAVTAYITPATAPSPEAHCYHSEPPCAPGPDSQTSDRWFPNRTVSARGRGGIPIFTGENMTIGTVKFFNTSKGFGFIAPEGGGKDVFVHATAVEQSGLRSLSEGQRVSFDIQPDARGSKAVNLKTA
jgi:CspA family cold shock protein